ncbi:MAG: helix-turn-helix domain-containing protein [Oryzomonas sp.]|jgi:DNA-binding IclR family transcriptional regulator
MCKGKYLQTVQAAEKTLELLELLATDGDKLRIGDLAGRLGVNRKEALLLLVALESRALLHWDEQTRIYRPAPKTGELVRRYLAQAGMKAVEAAPRIIKTPRAIGPRTPRGEVRRVAAGA